jgi:hypothetical protein
MIEIGQAEEYVITVEEVESRPLLRCGKDK